MRGQPLDAMIRPISDASACCADSVAMTDRSSLSTVTRTLSYETRSVNPSITPDRCTAAGQCDIFALLERTAAALIERELGPGRRIRIGGDVSSRRVAIELQLENAFARIGQGELDT